MLRCQIDFECPDEGDRCAPHADPANNPDAQIGFDYVDMFFNGAPKNCDCQNGSCLGVINMQCRRSGAHTAGPMTELTAADGAGAGVRRPGPVVGR
jgi:hypothetical protein